jgi:NAD(P)H dehydrogenase (quinone)
LQLQVRLGRLVVGELLKRVDSNALVALVRDPSKAHDLADLGVTVRQADYNNPETLAAALGGVDQLCASRG